MPRRWLIAVTSIAIVGVGAIGGVIAARLASARIRGANEHDITVCVREPVGGLRVDGIRVNPVELTSPRAAMPVDWLLLAVKAHQTAATAGWLSTLCGADTRIAVLQNGVEHRERVAPLVPEGSVIVPVVVDFPARMVARGEIIQYGPARLVVADTKAGGEFAGLLAGTDIEVRCTDDFLTAAWRKLCVNVASGALTALTQQGLRVFHRPDIADLGLALMEEARAVGRALGARLPTGLAEGALAGFRQAPEAAGSSMLWDRLAGRPLEYDARNGAVVRAGRRTGVATPHNRAIAALLAAISAGSDPGAPPGGPASVEWIGA